MSPSHPSIVIQSICTSWTKASRGGNNASVRNRTPDVLVLPSLTIPPTKNVFLLHEVNYSEWLSFQKPIEKLEQQEQTNPFRYDCLKLTFIENILHVTIEWEQVKGVPRRITFIRKGFLLQDHQWGRIIYNERLAWEGAWIYKKHVLNLGFFSPSSPKLFIKTEPAHSYIDMADLW